MAASLFNVGRYFSKTPAPTTPGDTSDAPPVDPNLTASQSADVQQPASPATPAPVSQNTPPPVQESTTVKTTQTSTVKTSEQAVSPAEKTPLQKRAGMDVLSRLTQRSNKALVSGVTKAKEMKMQMVDTEYVLWGLMQDAGIYQLVSDLKVVPTEFVAEIEKSFKPGNATESPKFSPRVKKVLELSFPIARRLGFEFISPEHILLGLAEEGEGLAAQLMAKKGITSDKLKKKIGVKKEGEEEKQQKSAISEYATDLTQMAQEGKLDPVIARSKEIERIMHILSRRTKNNPVLIGDAGVGKTAVVEGLALRIVQGNVPEPLLNKRILALDLTGMLAGASQRGEFEKRFQALISEVKASQGQIILFIDELHNLVGAGGSGGAMDASNILKPSLARGEMQTIGTTTISEYRKYIEKDRALERRFQPVLINEPSPEDAIEMLRGTKDKYEAFHKVAITDDAVKSAVKLSSRYIGDRFLPDKAVDLIDEAASAVRMPAVSLPEEIRSLEEEIKRQDAEFADAKQQNNTVKSQSVERKLEKLKKEMEAKKQEYEIKKGTSTTEVTPAMIQQIVSRWTGVPISRLTESESEKLVNLEDIIHKKLIDQEQAVAAVSEAVRRGRAGLSSRKRPIGSFIFMGPTGVGKTELAKVLAEELFGSPDMMVRLDMTEYMEKHEVAKLIGAPPGYVGYEEGGQLTEAVRRKPYSVVLLDEIEKAHPDVFNILLQILDDGRLTDNKGRTISFKNTILICTSNIGTGLIQKTLIDEMQVGELHVPKKDEHTVGTYVVTPTGRMIVTRGKEFWQLEQTKQTPPAAWTKKPISDYFAGQKLVEYDALSQNQKFPAESFDTHVVLPSGAEILTVDDRIWQRTSTTAKEWKTQSLIDYFKGHSVSNAEPDKPEQQLPTAQWETHAVSPAEKEVLSLGDRVWVRDGQQGTVWKTFTKEEYLKPAEAPVPDKIQTQPEPDKKTSPDAQQPPVYSSSELPKTETASQPNKSAATLPGAPDARKEKPDQAVEMPSVKAWDSHLFTPAGDEMIVVGSAVWQRKPNQPWQKQELSAVLSGQNTPVVMKKDEPSKEDAAFESKFMMLTEQLLEELRKFFKPELLNRFDEVIVFRPLTAQHMLAIVELQIESLRQMLEEQELGIEISDAVKEELTIVGFDPIYGARPLRRTIQRLVENPVSTMLIKRELKEGDTVVIDFDPETNDFVFTTRRPAAPLSTPPVGSNQEQSTVTAEDAKPVQENTVPGQPATSGTGKDESPALNTKQPEPAPENPPAAGGLTMDLPQKDESLSNAMNGTIDTREPQGETAPTMLGTNGLPASPAADSSASETSPFNQAGPVSPVSQPLSPTDTTELPSIPHFNSGLSGSASLTPPPTAPLTSSGGTQMQKSS
ncbi:MAG: AAA family ATPase [Candidatus Roizmanbacteria bacterium]|nr:AAA family ATPase [Candidatus Roizmanbacteria bacterium]